MRVLLLTFCFALTVQLIHAQADYRQGTVYLDGATSLTVGNAKYLKPDNVWQNPTVLQSNRVGIASRPVGVFAFDRLLVGAYMSYTNSWQGENFLDGSGGDLQTYRINPFVRYYVLAGAERKWNLFAELGFGTWGSGTYSTFETDFHLGAGVEMPLLPGVVGTAKLAYNAYADGLNYTTLGIRGNLLLGQLGKLVQAPLSRGTWTTRGELASASVGHMRRGDNDWLDYGYSFSPSVGYFVTDGLLLASHSRLTYANNKNEISPNMATQLNNFQYVQFRTELEARYYPWRNGTVLPYAGAALGYSYSKMDSERNNNPNNRGQVSSLWRATAGVSYFLGQSVALEASASYEREGSNYEGNGFTNAPFKFRNLGLDAGFAFYFGR